MRGRLGGVKTYTVECADRETGQPYCVRVTAASAAEAMQRINHAHAVVRSTLAEDAAPAASDDELSVMAPPVADAESVRLLREIDASLKTLLEHRLPSRLGQSDLSFIVGMGVVLSVPIGIVLGAVLLGLLALLVRLTPL